MKKPKCLCPDGIISVPTSITAEQIAKIRQKFQESHKRFYHADEIIVWPEKKNSWWKQIFAKWRGIDANR